MLVRRNFILSHENYARQVVNSWVHSFDQFFVLCLIIPIDRWLRVWSQHGQRKSWRWILQTDWGHSFCKKIRIGRNRKIFFQSAAAYVAYQPTPGNHEAADNFTHYFHRFTPPNGGDPIFYRLITTIWSRVMYWVHFSYDLDKIHFISFSTEVYFYTDYGYELIKRQFEWLQKDLKVNIHWWMINIHQTRQRMLIVMPFHGWLQWVIDRCTVPISMEMTARNMNR